MPAPTEILDEDVVVLVKAIPHVGKKHGETVCCAGVTPEGEWRRLYPIRFRHLKSDSKFKRWQFLSYRSSISSSDKRVESRRVHEESLRPGKMMKVAERGSFVSPLIAPSAKAAAESGQTLALIEPETFRFLSKARPKKKIEELKAKYARVSEQASFLDEELRAFQPAPHEFRVKFTDAAGPHDHACEDWETIAAYFRFSNQYGDAEALKILSGKYNDEYFPKGILLAQGNMASRPQTWLMLGIIRVNLPAQESLF